MATIEGAHVLNMEDQIGSLEAGKLADLVVFNPFLAAKAIPKHNPVSTLVYSATENNVEQVFVDGKGVLRDGVIVKLENEQKILAKS